MKYWVIALKCGLNYEQAKDYARRYRPIYITRPEWNGVHFFNVYGDYCILLKTGEVVINPEEIYDTDKDDWIEVIITTDAVRTIEKYTKLT